MVSNIALQVVNDDKMLYADSIVTIDPVVSLLIRCNKYTNECVCLTVCYFYCMCTVCIIIGKLIGK